MSVKPAEGPAVLLEGSASSTPCRSLEEAIRRAGRFLLRLQSPEGFWCGELESDTTLESDTLKLLYLLDRLDPDRQTRLVETIAKNQLPDGGWPIYRNGPAELNATVKAYLALRLTGWDAQDPPLERARRTILRLGGLERVNSFEKVYLALFGLYPWGQVPGLPPEIVLLPSWFPFNLYEISYWSRTILVPLSVIYALRPSWKRAPFSVDELWVNPSRKQARMTNFQKGGRGWSLFFLAVNELLKLYESLPWKPFRRRALAQADRWIKQRLVETDGLGAIFPAMVNAVFALKALGYQDGDPLFEQSVRELARLEREDGKGLKVQPCFSPVWDTALSVYILGKAGLPEGSDAIERGIKWLEQSEIRVRGDWAVKNPRGRPAGWAFQFRNPFYPDVDDTAQVLLAFAAHVGPSACRSTGAFQRGLDWILTMQNRDGGWSSFDKDNDCAPLTSFPFADHNAMLDPSACDITGRVLELLSLAGLSRDHPAVERGLSFLRTRQEPDGTWFGRWGVSYIYGSWLALRGLKACGEPMEDVRYQQAGRWLLSRQNADGGWGESCRSYDDPSTKGQGISTASQTAWALIALASLGGVREPAFQKGLEFLLQTQKEDGRWEEESFTGTGFPRVFYLKYHLYRIYFPLLALVEAKRQLEE